MIHAFLLAGQSNMAGRGSLPRSVPLEHDRILMWRGGRWQRAAEPVHQDKPVLAGAGLCMAFAHALLGSLEGEIGLIPCAMGGSALCEWEPGQPLFEGAVAEAHGAVQAGARLEGLLWHQGEADCTPARAGDYGARLEAVLSALRGKCGAPDLPVVVGELGEYLAQRADSPCWEQVNEQLRAAAARGGWGVARAVGLAHGGDGLHFGTDSLDELGKRYAVGYHGVLAGGSGAAPSGNKESKRM